MKRNVFFFAALTCAANLYAVEPVDTAKAVMLQDVQVTSTRAGKHTPMAFLISTKAKSRVLTSDRIFLISFP